MNNTIIIEDGINTSYIDTLFMAMFFKPSYIQNMLSEYPNDLKILYLQDLIYYNFVCNLRHNYIIDSSIMNEIRNYMFFCGWKNGSHIMDLHEVQDLYEFLESKINFNKIKLNVNSNLKIYSYITLNVTENINTQELINKWITTNFESYKLENIPNIIPLYIKKSDENYLVDITKAISFKLNNIDENQFKNIWLIHSIICYSKVNSEYYSVLKNDTNWYIFSNKKNPSLNIISNESSLKISKELSLKIKKECVFIFYYTHDKIK